jgi:hypothetical protein
LPDRFQHAHQGEWRCPTRFGGLPLGAAASCSHVSVESEGGLAAGAFEQMAVTAQHEDSAVCVSELLGDRLDSDRLPRTRVVRGRDQQRGARVTEIVERQAVERSRLIASDRGALP